MLGTIYSLLQHKAIKFEMHMLVLSTVGVHMNTYIGALVIEILFHNFNTKGRSEFRSLIKSNFGHRQIPHRPLHSSSKRGARTKRSFL